MRVKNALRSSSLLYVQNVKKLSVEENITQESHIPSKDVDLKKVKT